MANLLIELTKKGQRDYNATRFELVTRLKDESLPMATKIMNFKQIFDKFENEFKGAVSEGILYEGGTLVFRFTPKTRTGAAVDRGRNWLGRVSNSIRVKIAGKGFLSGIF